MSFIPEIELQSLPVIRLFQEEKLRDLLYYVEQHSPFYQQHTKRHGIVLSQIQSLTDLTKIPPTTKDDLQQYNWDFLCVPQNQVAEFTSTSGTMGKPVTIALTKNDVKRLAYNEYISFACAEGTQLDLYQLSLTMDRQFMAGMAYYEGIRQLGAGLVRVGPGLPALQWETIERLKPTVLVAVPSFLLTLLKYAAQHGIDVNQTSITRAICIGENIRTTDFSANTIARQIYDQWNIELFGTYASTEMQTAFTECKHGIGGHHHPELVIVEVLDENDQPVSDGSAGEITVTTLGVEGMPLLRYKTGDMATLHHEPCVCGRNTLRLGPILGRQQQMIKLKGTTLYPPGIFDIIQHVPSVVDYVVEVLTNELQTDEIKLYIVCDAETKHETEIALRTAFQSRLRVVPTIEFVQEEFVVKIQQMAQSRKVKRFIDSRKSNWL